MQPELSDDTNCTETSFHLTTPKANHQKTIGTKRKKTEINEVGGSNTGDPMVDVLKNISSSIPQVIPSTQDKLNCFANYIISEVRDLPQTIQEEFIDETIIRLLKIKRKNRKT